MRKSRFTDEQVVAILREGDRDPIPVVAKRHGASEQTIYTWRKRFPVVLETRADETRTIVRQRPAANGIKSRAVTSRSVLPEACAS
jgi:transposase